MSKWTKAQTSAPAVVIDVKPLTLVGLEHTPRGWVVVSAILRGDKLEAKETHCPPQGKEWAAKILRRVMQQRVLFPRGV